MRLAAAKLGRMVLLMVVQFEFRPFSGPDLEGMSFRLESNLTNGDGPWSGIPCVSAEDLGHGGTPT